MTVCYPFKFFTVLGFSTSLNSTELTNRGKKILWLKEAVAFLNMNSNPAEK